MSEPVSHEVARHAAVESAKHSECLIVVAIGLDQDGESTIRLSRVGQPPESPAGTVMRVVWAAVGELLGEIT